MSMNATAMHNFWQHQFLLQWVLSECGIHMATGSENSNISGILQKKIDSSLPPVAQI
jgi:hypothetical protein